jgi:hypothetical protein
VRIPQDRTGMRKRSAESDVKDIAKTCGKNSDQTSSESRGF